MPVLLGPSSRGAFDDALVLYALFDVHLFRNAVKLGDRDRFLHYQVGLLETICAVGRERSARQGKKAEVERA